MIFIWGINLDGGPRRGIEPRLLEGEMPLFVYELIVIICPRRSSYIRDYILLSRHQRSSARNGVTTGCFMDGSISLYPLPIPRRSYFYSRASSVVCREK